MPFLLANNAHLLDRRRMLLENQDLESWEFLCPGSLLKIAYGFEVTFIEKVFSSAQTFLFSINSFSISFSSGTLKVGEELKGPITVDYNSLLQEDEFHQLANSTIHHLQEKLEEYGDIVQVDGYDVDYGNEVLTLKLGALGRYVLDKQTPNRQIWLSSPVSGPSRFDWDCNAKAWVYRRTKANLLELLESELQELCGERIDLS